MRVCERFGLIPPACAASWDETSFWGQAKLLAYDNIRSQEEFDLIKAQAGAG